MPPDTLPLSSAKLKHPSTPFLRTLDRFIQEATAKGVETGPELPEKRRHIRPINSFPKINR